MSFWARWWMVAAAMAITDAMWTWYISGIAHKQWLVAGLASAGLIATGAFVVTSYVDDKRLILPAAIGACIGTWVAMYFLA